MGLFESIRENMHPAVRNFLETSGMKERMLLSFLNSTAGLHPLSRDKTFSRNHVSDMLRILQMPHGKKTVQRMAVLKAAGRAYTWSEAWNFAHSAVVLEHASNLPASRPLPWELLVGPDFKEFLERSIRQVSDQRLIFETILGTRKFHDEYGEEPFKDIGGKPFSKVHASKVTAAFLKHGQKGLNRLLNNENLPSIHASVRKFEEHEELLKDPSEIVPYFSDESEMRKNLRNVLDSVARHGKEATLAALRSGARGPKISNQALLLIEKTPGELANKLLGKTVSSGDLRWALEAARTMQESPDERTIVPLAVTKHIFGGNAVAAWKAGARPHPDDPKDSTFYLAAQMLPTRLVKAVFSEGIAGDSFEQKSAAIHLAAKFGDANTVHRGLTQGKSLDEIKVELENRAERQKFEPVNVTGLAIEQLRRINPDAAKWVIDTTRRKER